MQNQCLGATVGQIECRNPTHVRHIQSDTRRVEHNHRFNTRNVDKRASRQCGFVDTQRVAISATINHIRSSEHAARINDVRASLATDRLIAAAQRDGVCTSTTRNNVSTSTSADDVSTIAAENSVIARVGHQRIGARATHQEVRTRVTHKRVVTLTSIEVGAAGAQRIQGVCGAQAELHIGKRAARNIVGKAKHVESRRPREPDTLVFRRRRATRNGATRLQLNPDSAAAILRRRGGALERRAVTHLGRGKGQAHGAGTSPRDRQHVATNRAQIESLG